MPKIEVDFYSDWIGILRRELVASGFAPPANGDDQETCFRYFNLQKRSISARPRTVQTAAGFAAPQEHQAGVDAISEKFVAGTDLTPHLSRTLTDSDYDDAMLNDWGIHHLHLGTAIDASGFVERTGPLLFVRVTHEHAYFLAVLSHGQWANQQLVQTIHDNWPDTIQQYRLSEIVDVADVPTDKEILQLRRGRVSTIIRMPDGTVYAPIGGGVMTSGLSADVLAVCDRYARAMKKLEEHVFTQSDKLLAKLVEAEVEVGESVALRLHVIDGQFVAVHEASRIGFGLLQVNAV